MSSVIRRCCQIKAGVVERDPKEMGERALLNLGHTVGHAVEKLKNFQLLHGQCVAVGMAAAAWISKSRGLLTEEEYKEILNGCCLYDLPVTVEGLSQQEVLAATKNDKKMEQGQIKFILMKGIGCSFIDRTVSDQELLEALQVDPSMTSIKENARLNKACPEALSWLLWGFLFLGLTFFDQWTKSLAKGHLQGTEGITLIPSVLKLSYLENRGMAFGMFQGKQFIFIGLCLVFLDPASVSFCQDSQNLFLSSSNDNRGYSRSRGAWQSDPQDFSWICGGFYLFSPH